MENKIYHKGLVLLIIIILIKIVFGFYLENTNPNFFFTTDSHEYINPAKEICESGKFNNVDKEAEIRRTPGTSIFLLPAVCLDLNLKKYVVFLNLIMVLLSAYFTYKIVRILNIEISPILIFLIYLIDPTLSKHQYNILSDIIFLFWFTLTLYFLFTGLKNINFIYFLVGFVGITFITFIRPITLYLPYYLSIFLILFYLLNYSFRITFKFPLLIACLLGLILHFSLTQLWTYRNYKATGVKEFTYLKAQNNYLFKTAGIIAQNQKRDFLDVQEEFRNKVINLSKNEFINYSNSELKNAMLNYPLETIIVGFKGSVMTLFTPGTGQYPRMFNISGKNYKILKFFFHSIGLIWLILMGVFALYGIIKIDKNIFFLFLILIFAYLLLASSGPGSYSRFRIPFMPLIIVLISCGFQNFLKRVKKN